MTFKYKAKFKLTITTKVNPNYTKLYRNCFYFRDGCQWSKFGGTNDFESLRYGGVRLGFCH